MKSQRPVLTDDEHRVLKFRPRTLAQPPGRQSEAGREASQTDVRQEANDLSRYERTGQEPDDFRHRMLANMAAFAFTVALTAIGIWLAMSIADLRKTQDCVLMVGGIAPALLRHIPDVSQRCSGFVLRGRGRFRPISGLNPLLRRH